MDYDDPKIEAQWCSERRSEVEAYLDNERLVRGRVGDWPAWHLAPYVSIWAIESRAVPGHVGWWAICGDLPTDYVSSASIKHPRDAMLAFADRWHRAVELMARGDSPKEFVVGDPSNWPTLSPLLASRADLLRDFATKPGQWDEP